MHFTKRAFGILLLMTTIFGSIQLKAQTEDDAIMMNKKQFCNGITYTNNHWKEYWEGTFKRTNQNIGKITTQSTVLMSAYGITNDLNILAGVPYVWTKSSEGTLHGLKGFQDLSLHVKWRFLKLPVSGGTLSLFAVGGFSTPLSNYSVDFLPMSIGLGTTNVSGRLTADYQHGIFYATLSSAYTRRSNVKLDRTSYYTTGIHYTNEVEMPNVVNSNFNLGIRKKYLIAEAVLMNMITTGGFDMRKNDMPFVSNKMNSTSLGVHAKYTLQFFQPLQIIGGADRTINGFSKNSSSPFTSRNVGQAWNYFIGAYYRFTFKSKTVAKN